MFVEIDGQYLDVIGKKDNVIFYQPMNNIDNRRKIIALEIEMKGKLNWFSSEEFKIDDLIETLNEFKNGGATHIHIDADTSYDLIKTELTPYCHRLETLEEYKERMEKLDWIEKKETEKQEARERSEFERLKSKFS